MHRALWAGCLFLAMSAAVVAQEAPSLDLLTGDWASDVGQPVRFERAGASRWRYQRQDAAGRVERGTAWQLGLTFLLKRDERSGSGVLSRVDAPRRPGEAQAGEAYYRFTGGDLVLARGASRRPGERLSRTRAGGNQLELLVDGPEAYPSMHRAIASARRSICVQFFSWFDDQSGQRFADALIARARAGVQVKVLMEAFPQKGGMGWKTGPYLRAGGVDVRLHHTLSEGLKNSFTGFFRRLWNGLRGKKEPPREKRGILNHDHRKLLVVDGREAFTGGMNVGDKYEEGTTWHDIHCRVAGPAVAEMEAMFWDRWRAAGGQGQALPPLGAAQGGPYPVEVLENLPGIRLDITRRFLEEIERARGEILIENPYFLYDPVVNALKRKAGQGVRTIVIVPSNDLNDEALARDAMFWVQNDIVNAGIDLRKYRERMCHGKVAVFDRRVATLGTTNLDMLAMERNAELNLFVPDAGFSRLTIQRVFVPDIAGSDPVRVEKRSWWEKLKGAVMYAIRGIL